MSQAPAGGAAAAPAASPDQMQATLCEHLIGEFEPLWEAPISVDAGISKQWLALAVVLEQDAVAYEAVSDAVFAAELRGVADAAYSIALVTDPSGWSTSRDFDEASAAMKRQVQNLAVALPDDACIDHDRAAQASLRNGLVAAITALMDAENSEIAPADMGKIEPSLTFAGDEPATMDAVSINMMAGDEVVMSLMSGSGTVFCIGHSPDESVQGTVDAVGATSLADCGDSESWQE